MNKERAMEILATCDGCSLDSEEDRERVALAIAQDVTRADVIEQRAARLVEDILQAKRLGKKERANWSPDTDKAKAALLDNVTLAVRALRDVIGDRSPVLRQREYRREPCRHSHGDTMEFHESFGVAQFNQVSGSRKLFNSPMVHHGHFIRLEINRAERLRSTYDNARVWDAHVNGDVGFKERHIVTVEFSAAQFAALITTMNMGSGTACTVSEVAGVHMDAVPDEVRHEHAEIVDDIRRGLKSANVTNYAEQARVILEKKGAINKGDRAKLQGLVNSAENHLRTSLPFYVERFNEGIEKVGTAMKAEVEGVLTSAVHRLGIQKLAEGGAEVLAKALTPGNDDD